MHACNVFPLFMKLGGPDPQELPPLGPPLMMHILWLFKEDSIMF